MSNHSTNVIPFNFGKRQVRTLLIDDQPWFVAKDVIASLEYAKSSNPARVIDHVPAQWKGVNQIHTPGGAQQILMLSEQGLYFFIGRSDKPKAIPFQMWLAGEVLPSIRKTGAYADAGNKMATLMDELIGMSETNALKGLARHKVSILPVSSQRSAAARIYSAVHTRFNVPRLELIPASQFEAACNFVAAYAVHEGEYLPGDKAGSLSMSIRDWMERCPILRANQAFQPANKMLLTGKLVADMDTVKPLDILMNALKKQGVDVSAYDAHYQFLLDYLRENRRALREAMKRIEQASENSFSFHVRDAA